MFNMRRPHRDEGSHQHTRTIYRNSVHRVNDVTSPQPRIRGKFREFNTNQRHPGTRSGRSIPDTPDGPYGIQPSAVVPDNVRRNRLATAARHSERPGSRRNQAIGCDEVCAALMEYPRFAGPIMTLPRPDAGRRKEILPGWIHSRGRRCASPSLATARPATMSNDPPRKRRAIFTGMASRPAVTKRQCER